MQEVSSVRSTNRRIPFQRNYALRPPVGKEQIHLETLHPQYVMGFIDGEGSFSVSINKQKTTRSGIEVRPEFEMELRADDREILERIMITIGCGRVYDCSYERYGWYPHSKYKISSTREVAEYLIPFVDKHKLQAKKAECYRIFREIVLIVRRKEHLTEQGVQKIIGLREEIRKHGKKHREVETARIRENRLSSGVDMEKAVENGFDMSRIPPVKSEERGAPEVPVYQDRR